jgi:hypothetical protein
MDDVMMKLPLRLVPRKIGAVFRSFFFLFFFGFAVFWTAMASTAILSGPIQNEPFQGFRYAFPAFGIPFLLIGFFGLASAILKLIPGSPYYHVEISSQGLKVRRGWKIQQFRWSEISPFGLSTKTRSTKGGKITTYWVVALRVADAGYLASDSERYNRSVLKIDTGDYASVDVDNAAVVLVDWLNGIRTDAIERPGHAIDTVAVPPDFRGVAREIGITAPQSAVSATSAGRSSVIER